MKKLWLLLLTCLLMTGCAREQDGPLTEQEIARANEAFHWMREVEEDGDTVVRVSEVSCFFTRLYEKPSQIGLEELLRYCPLGTDLGEEDGEEYRAVLTALEIQWEPFPLPGDYVVPVHRYRRADVSAMLREYAGITAEDLTDTEGILYLEAYDAYYNITSDFAPGFFECTGGERKGDTIRFWSEEDAAGIRRVLTVRKQGEGYKIYAFTEE